MRSYGSSLGGGEQHTKNLDQLICSRKEGLHTLASVRLDSDAMSQMGHELPLSHIRAESVLPPTADIRRRIATCHDKLAANYIPFIKLASIRGLGPGFPAR